MAVPQGRIVPTAATPRFPGCALSCVTLLQAQQICMPPNTPPASQLVYNQCFCSSPFLTPFRTSPDILCIQDCAIPTDRQRLQAWFGEFCQNVANGIDPTTLTATLPAAASPAPTPTVASNPPTSILTVTSGTARATITATGTPNNTSPSAQRDPWINTHWQWVLMLVILALGLAGLAWLAVWLKRRHRRKLDGQRAAASGFSRGAESRSRQEMRQSSATDLWGPHQMMQATQGYRYNTEPETDTGSAAVAAGASDKRHLTRNSNRISSAPTRSVSAAAEQGLPIRPQSTRARPSDLEMNARMIGAADRNSKLKREGSKLRKSPAEQNMPPERSTTPRIHGGKEDGDFEKT